VKVVGQPLEAPKLLFIAGFGAPQPETMFVWCTAQNNRYKDYKSKDISRQAIKDHKAFKDHEAETRRFSRSAVGEASYTAEGVPEQMP